MLPLGLTLAFASALAVNWAYAREHDAAAVMPPFSPRQPLRFVSLLLGNRAWLIAFATETAGWLIYVAALRLAPISLVQAICASGIGMLAFAGTHGHPTRLAPYEQLAVLIAFAGLLLLGLSLVGTLQVDHAPRWTTAAGWLAASTAAALTLAKAGIGLARGPALGLAAGLLFAGGDISAKLVVYGGIWLAAVSTLIVCYALGTSILQGAFQHGDVLTGAGLATLAANAVPIAAGFVVFGEQLPHGAKGTLQLAAFACLVASAAVLTTTGTGGRSSPSPAGPSCSDSTSGTFPVLRLTPSATFERLRKRPQAMRGKPPNAIVRPGG